MSTQSLVSAELIWPFSVARGITAWRERGLTAVDSLCDHYLSQLRLVAPHVELRRAPFLDRPEVYDIVFREYVDSTWRFTEDNDEVGWMANADSMIRNVEHAQLSEHRTVLSFGELFRKSAVPMRPLFREQLIWPTVQLTTLAPAASAWSMLLTQQRAFQATLHQLGLATFLVEPFAQSHYAARSVHVVALMPHGPTVLATGYLMSGTYQQRLRMTESVIDVGWTGKALAILAELHCDSRGIVLPSPINPLHVAVLHLERGDEARRLVESLEGWRTSLVPCSSPSMIRRRERHLVNLGVPVVCSLAGNRSTLTERVPLTRKELPAAPTAQQVVAALAEQDHAILCRARDRQARGSQELLTHACEDCLASLPHAFGWVHEDVRGECGTCGRPSASAVLVSPTGRFY